MITVELHSHGRAEVYDEDTLGVTGSIKVSIEKAMEIIERQHNKGHNCSIICRDNYVEIEQEHAMSMATNYTIKICGHSWLTVKYKHGGRTSIASTGFEDETIINREKLLHTLNEDMRDKGLAVAEYLIDEPIHGEETWKSIGRRYEAMFESPK